MNQYSVPPPGVSEAPRPGQDVWLEAKAPDGKPYYYHITTMATVWTLPPGAELWKPPGSAPPVAAATDSAAPGGGAASQPQPLGSAAQNAVAQAQAASQYQLGAQPVPASTLPSVSLQQPPPQLAPHLQQPPPGMMPGHGVAPHPLNPHPAGMLGPGMHNPMFGMGMPPGFNPFAPMMPPSMVMPQVQRDPADWAEYANPGGRSYWYNSKINQHSWEKPLEVIQHEERKKAEAAAAEAQAKAGQPGDVRPAEAKKEVSTKPIATKTIPGTPWCIVWTNDKKSFFHNPTTKASVWKPPPELQGMKEVDDLLAQIPEDATPATSVEPAKTVTTNGETNGGVKRDTSETVEEPSAKRVRASSVDEGSLSDASSSDAGALASAPKASTGIRRAPPPQKQKPKDPAAEAELKAAKDREQIPLDERIRRFKELLLEKDVSAYSTWEKELHKIVFDPRYLLLTSKDRRDVFDDFMKEKADREREEKKKKIGEMRENFKALMTEANLSLKSTFSDFSSKYGKDERYKGIERMKERETMFDDFMHELRKKEKELRRAESDKIRSNFLEMLQEVPGLTRKSHWSDVKKTLRDDPRYERVDSSNQREEWFRDYVKTLAKKKEKESDTEDKDKEKHDEEDEKVRQDRDRQERAEASMRERERQVQEEMSSITKDREKEREHHRHDEAVQHYKALLTDLIRQTDLTYKAARKILKKDERYELADPLNKHQKEQIYDDHLHNLNSKKKQTYRELLDETNIPLDAPWKEVRRKIRDDVRYGKFSSKESKCESEFNKYIKDKIEKAWYEFEDLLKETKLLDHKSKSRIEESEQHMKDLVEILKNDARYLNLEPFSYDRKKKLNDFIEQLAKRGPPPPPTASEPTRRSGK